MIDKRLVMLLDEKISMLQADGEDKNRKMEEIKHVKRIIKVLQNNPFNLYTLKPEELKVVVSILPEEIDFVEKVAKYRTIYEGCLQFGREAIPQVSLIEDYVRTTQATLEEKGHELTDKIASYQYTDAKLRKYSDLFEEINDEDSLITDTSTLIDLINSSNLSDEEKNDIKLSIIKRNNAVYGKAVAANTKVEISEKSDIELIEEQLRQEFSDEVLVQIKSISDNISICKSEEEIDAFLKGCKYSFRDSFYPKVIAGIIAYQNIELLVLRSVVGQDEEEYIDDINVVKQKIGILRKYAQGAAMMDDLEKNAEPVNLEDNRSKLEVALENYKEDPLKTPNCVLFLGKQLLGDIKDIEDRETLEDVFLLIEQLKNEEENKHGLKGDGSLKGIGLLKPKSRGRQARVAFTHLDDNVYGIMYIFGKKADNPKSVRSTIDYRRRNFDLDKLRRQISDPEVMDSYIEMTKDISLKLKSYVSGDIASVKEKTGGTK